MTIPASFLLWWRTKGSLNTLGVLISERHIILMIFVIVVGLCAPVVGQEHLPWYILPRDKAERFLEGVHGIDYLYQLRVVGDNRVLNSPSVINTLTKLLEEGTPASRARFIRYLTPFQFSRRHPLVEHITSLLHKETPDKILTAALVFLEQHMDPEAFLRLSRKPEVRSAMLDSEAAQTGSGRLFTLAENWADFDREAQVASLDEIVDSRDIAQHVKQATVAFSCVLDQRDRHELVRRITSGDNDLLARDAIYQASWDDTPENRIFLLTQIKRQNVAIACEVAQALGISGDVAAGDSIERYVIEYFSKPYRKRVDRGATLGLRHALYNEFWRAIFHCRARSLDPDSRAELYDQVLTGSWKGNTAGGKVTADVLAIKKLQGLLNSE